MSAATDEIPYGRIDIHSHMIPAVDDGCQSFDESVASIAMLKQHGYVGTICTPHLWPDWFPANTPDQVRAWTEGLRIRLRDSGIEYHIWAGGELRIFDGVIAWMKKVGVPTLGPSKLVLCDFWEPEWRKWIDQAFDWLLNQGYTPVLAHPERLSIRNGLSAKLTELTERGVLLQGNFRCVTGGEGVLPDAQMRQWLNQGRYSFLAMDMHRPEALPGRIEGLEIVRREWGADFVDRMTITDVRKRVFGLE